MPEVRALSTDPPTVREAVDIYVQEKQEALNPEQLRVLGAALHALLRPAMEEPVTTITPLRLALLGGELKAKVSPKTGRPLAASTFRRYVLINQEFYTWTATRWPRTAKQPGQAAEQDPDSGQHLGDLIRILRTDAALSRADLAAQARIAEPVLKLIELRRRLPTRRQLDRLTSVQAMAGLLDWAAREGAAIDLAPEEDGGTSTREDGGST